MEKKTIQRLNNIFVTMQLSENKELNITIWLQTHDLFHKEKFYLTKHFSFTNLLEVNKIQGLLTLGIQPPPKRQIGNYLIPYWEVIRIF